MKYTDDTKMPFGRFKGTKLANVPADMLLWYLDNIPNLSPLLKDYIEVNKNTLKMEALADRQRAMSQQRFLNK